MQRKDRRTIKETHMKNLIVVNGEADWQKYFAGIEVHQVYLQTSRWLYHDEKLWVFDSTGVTPVDGVLWRVGAIKPHSSHRSTLELIRFAQIPCVNPVQVLLRGYDRLSMLNELREAGLPLLPYSIALGERILDVLQPTLPAVIKVGNYHGGFGKARLQDEGQWADLKDLLFVIDEYVTIEPYIDYEQDIRCLAVGNQLWAMARQGTTWKVNNQTASYQVIDPPPILQTYTRQVMSHFNADILGLDFLLTRDGNYVLLESNDIPGLSGFPDKARQAVARRVREKLEASA
jgi:ribosomal protein S6--L-glutamate ligase